MIHLKKLYDNFKSEYNTSQLGIFRPSADFVPACHEISLDIFNALAGMSARSQKIEDWLMPFTVTLNIAVQKKPAYDLLPKPTDDIYPGRGYEYYKSSRVIVEKDVVKCENQCDLFKDGQVVPWADVAEDFFPATETSYEQHSVTLVVGNKWASVLRHKTRGPRVDLPYMRQIDEGFEVMPKDMGVIILDYYRKPKEPIFNYNLVRQDPDVFEDFIEQGSVHLEWSETLIPVFLYRLGKRYGLTIQNRLILEVRAVDKLFE